MCCVLGSQYLCGALTAVRVYRIRWAVIGLLSYMVSIVAIEVILKWNKVSNVYSIASTGQYVGLIIGLGSFASVCWTLVRQESVSNPFCKVDLCFADLL